MSKKIKIIIIIIFLLLLGISSFFYFKVKKTLTPERQKISVFPNSYNIKYKDISFKTKDNLTLKGWWIEGKNDKTIIFAHSFGSNRSGWEGYDAKGNFHKISWLKSIKKLSDYGYNIIAFDHRACGESEGNLSYFGKKEALDIEAAVNWLGKEKPKLKKIGIIGFSTGANSTLRALKILEQNNKDLLLVGIIVNTYWYDKMVENSLNFFTNIPSSMLPIIKFTTKQIVKFDPTEEINPTKTIKQINSPILIVNSEFDEIASITDIKEIYNSRKENTELKILKGKDRFFAYHFIEENSKLVIKFFDEKLK